MDEAVRAKLVTIGRRSGMNHTVMLRAVMYGGDFYFSRHRPDSDWFLNAVSNPQVQIAYEDIIISGTASRVDDEDIMSIVSNLKYPGEARAHERRVMIRVRPVTT